MNRLTEAEKHSEKILFNQYSLLKQSITFLWIGRYVTSFIHARQIMDNILNFNFGLIKDKVFSKIERGSRKQKHQLYTRKYKITKLYNGSIFL